MSDRLKPCPFCGGEAHAITQFTGSFDELVAHHSISCNGCGVVAFFEDTEAEAVEAWNTRATDDRFIHGRELRELVEREFAERTCHVVPHGYCIANGEKSSCRCWSCSECSYGWHVSDYDRQYRYCPNCGARVVER